MLLVTQAEAGLPWRPGFSVAKIRFLHLPCSPRKTVTLLSGWSCTACANHPDFPEATYQMFKGNKSYLVFYSLGELRWAWCFLLKNKVIVPVVG